LDRFDQTKQLAKLLLPCFVVKHKRKQINAKIIECRNQKIKWKIKNYRTVITTPKYYRKILETEKLNRYP